MAHMKMRHGGGYVKVGNASMSEVSQKFIVMAKKHQQRVLELRTALQHLTADEIKDIISSKIDNSEKGFWLSALNEVLDT